jgi:quercetin dioxygenase-like cupin family protein
MSPDHNTAAPTRGVARTPLLVAAIDGAKRVARVDVRRIELAPGQRSGLHLHSCPVIGVIVSGSVFFQVDGSPGRVLHPGEAFFEPAGAHVPHFDARDDGATFIAYYLLGPDEDELITMLE